MVGNLILAIIFLAEVTLGSWNMKWFPSGRSEHRVSARVEQANYEDAAEVIRKGLKESRHILFFQELRDARVTTNLITTIGFKTLMPVVTSEFKMSDRRLGWQQCAIATDLPVLDSRWAYWRPADDWRRRPPRGYAYALIDAGEDGLIACYCIHLKSNYGATTSSLVANNAAKRELAMTELVELVNAARSPDGRKISKYVIAGDFNTDPFSGCFANEKTTQILEEAKFINCFAGEPLKNRGTHPGNKTYPDTTLDFFFHKGFDNVGRVTMSPAVPLSDHRMIWMVVGGEKR